MLYSPYWYLVLVAFAAAALGAVGLRKGSSDIVLAYLSLTTLAALKNVGVLYLFSTNGGAQGYNGLVIAVALLDLVAVEPLAFYNAFFLYRSMRTELTFDQVED